MTVKEHLQQDRYGIKNRRVRLLLKPQLRSKLKSTYFLIEHPDCEQVINEGPMRFTWYKHIQILQGKHQLGLSFNFKQTVFILSHKKTVDLCSLPQDSTCLCFCVHTPACPLPTAPEQNMKEVVQHYRQKNTLWNAKNWGRILLFLLHPYKIQYKSIIGAFYRAVCNHVDAIAVSISCPLSFKAMLLKQFHIHITLTRTSEHWTPDSGSDEVAAEKRF